MADVIPFKHKPQEKKSEWFWGHECKNFLFKLRSDGSIVCDKCDQVIGEWSQDAEGNPIKPA